MTAKNVADYFLAIAPEDDLITNMKVQKLVYYAQGFSLAIFDSPLFDDDIEAWTHGPVVPSLYHEYKLHGSKPLPIPEIEMNKYSSEVAELLDEVYAVYGQFTATALRGLTHHEPPWRDTPAGSIISHDKMIEYFKTQIN